MLLDSLKDTLHNAVRYHNVQILSSETVQIAASPNTSPSENDGVFDITSSTPGAPAMLALTCPLADSALFWKVGMRPDRPALQPDTSTSIPISLVNSAPLGCLMDSADRNIMAFAYSQSADEIDMRYGVDEERAVFTVVLDIARIAEHSQLKVVADQSRQSADVIRALGTWMRQGLDAFPVSPLAEEPVFSTWYAYLQNIDDAELRSQAEGMRALGCRSIFIDDGWQRFGHGRGYAGCGDWVEDEEKFPDLHATVQVLRSAGLASLLWVAPLLLGEKSGAFSRMEPYAPLYCDGNAASKCRVLDPRRAAVRDHIANIVSRLVSDYGVAGLKIDFLDQGRLYQGQPLRSPEPGDVNDVGEAMCLLLAQIRDVLVQKCSEVPIVEFRQPYSSPGIASFSNIIRASDCAADAVTNRMRAIDERLISTTRVVHGDMLLWHADASAEACAEQIMATFFAVPQISVRPSEMSPEQTDTCRYLLQVWRQNRDILLHGRLDPIGAAEGYPLVNAYGCVSNKVADAVPTLVPDVPTDMPTDMSTNMSTDMPTDTSMDAVADAIAGTTADTTSNEAMDVAAGAVSNTAENMMSRNAVNSAMNMPTENDAVGKQISAVYCRGMIVDVDTSTVQDLLVLNATHETTVVLRLHGAQQSTVNLSGNAHNCRGELLQTWTDALVELTALTASGLVEVPVPPFGVLHLTLS